MDDRSLGGHGGVAILCPSLLAANQDQETPFELKRRKTKKGTKGWVGKVEDWMQGVEDRS